jgi:hypothetical protein
MPHRIRDVGASPVRLWQGDPDCDALHAFVLDALKEIESAFLEGENALNCTARLPEILTHAEASH